MQKGVDYIGVSVCGNQRRAKAGHYGTRKM